MPPGTSTDAPFSCEQCGEGFTRRENLERHQRSRHSSDTGRPHNCQRCGTSFARRDVFKRHVQRCERGLHTRSKKRVKVTPRTEPHDQGNNTGSDAAAVPDHSLLGPAADAYVLSQNGVNSTRGAREHFDMLTPHDFDVLSRYPPSSTSTFSMPLLSEHGITPRMAASHTASYFAHFQPYFPIIHRPTFRLVGGHDLLSAIVVAIGSVHTDARPSGCLQDISDRIWLQGVQEMERYFQGQSIMFREPWTLQACLLHIIYGFYFADKASGACWTLLNTLVRNLRPLCLMNQHLTLFANTAEPWAANIPSAANWNSHDLSEAWMVFASQEAFRLCMFALVLLDQYMATPCNTRPLIPATELSWELPPAQSLWDAPSADEWLLLVQEQIHQGLLTLPGNPGRIECSSLSQVTQALMTGNPPIGVMSRLSASPFAEVCVLANIESLVREFTFCYYQMPPVLPDPSAYHILSPNQNRPINSAITTLLTKLASSTFECDQIARLLHLGCWTARLALSEPDDLLLSGIVDNSLTAGLATSAHLILGSSVATRRAVGPVKRRFGEDASMTAWDDLLKSLSTMNDSTKDRSLLQAPWMTILAYRLLLLLWRTLRRAIGEIEQQNVQGLDAASLALSPATVMSSLIVDKTRQCFVNDQDLTRFEDLREFEVAFINLMAKNFAEVRTPVGRATSEILREIGEILGSGQD